MTPESVDTPTEGADDKRDYHRRAFFALGWSSIGTLAMAAANAVAVVVLARLIDPSAFGVIAAATAIGLLLKAAGPYSVTQATLRVGDDADVLKAGTNVAWVVSLVMGAALFVLAGPLGDLLEMGNDAWVLRAWVPVLWCQGLAVPAQVVLQRGLRFREITVVQALSTVLGSAMVPIGLGIAGLGVGALYFGVLAQAAIETVGLALCVGRVSLPGRGAAATREVARTTGTFSTLSVVGGVANQGDSLVVAATLGNQALGFYSRAYRLMSLPANMLGDAIDTVLFPVILGAKDDLASVARGIRLATRLLSLTIVPLSAVCIVLGPVIVEVLLGSQWTGAGRTFQILSAGMFFRLATKPMTAALRGLGRQSLLTGVVAAYAAGVVLAALVGGQWGIEVVAAGLVVVLVGFFVAVAVLTARTIDQPVSSFFSAASIGLPGAIVAAVLALAADRVLADSGALTRMVLGSLAGAVPAAAALAFPGPRRALRTLAAMRH